MDSVASIPGEGVVGNRDTVDDRSQYPGWELKGGELDRKYLQHAALET